MAEERAAAFMLKEHRIDSRRRDRGGHRDFAAGDPSSPHEWIPIDSRVEFSKVDREIRREHEKKSLNTILTGNRNRIRGDVPGVRLQWHDGGSDRIRAKPKVETRSKLA
jgi:hypothetical protein